MARQAPRPLANRAFACAASARVRRRSRSAPSRSRRAVVPHLRLESPKNSLEPATPLFAPWVDTFQALELLAGASARLVRVRLSAAVRIWPAMRRTPIPDLRWLQGPREVQPFRDHARPTPAPAGGELVLSLHNGPSVAGFIEPQASSRRFDQGALRDKRLWFVVVDLDVVPNRLLQLSRGTMGASADVLLCQRGEPAFDLVEPGR